jgi:DNA-binding GntR family transcriptional regulator
MPEHLKVYEAVAARDGAAGRAAMEDLIELALGDTKHSLSPGRAKKSIAKAAEKGRRKV